MGTFFYDSLDTLQKVTFPTKQDYISLTLSVIVTIIISGALFIGMDSLFSGLYRGTATALRQDKTAAGIVATGALQGLGLGTGAVVATGTDVRTGDKK